jgi:hypothetical protein
MPAPQAPVGSAPAPTAPAAAYGTAPTAPIVVLPPPRFASPPPKQIAFTAPPIEEKRRYGDAGAPFAIGMGGAIRFRSDAGYQKLHAGDHQTELDLFASYDVYQPVRRIVIAAGLNYRNAQLGDDQTVAINTNAIQADVIARYTLTTFLFPQIRAGVGAQLSRIDLEDSSGQFSAHDHSASASGSIGAGLTIQTPRRLFETRRGRLASLSLGVLVEGGYAFAAAANYHLKVSSDSDLADSEIALGKLDLGGPYLRINGVVRF